MAEAKQGLIQTYSKSNIYGLISLELSIFILTYIIFSIVNPILFLPPIPMNFIYASVTVIILSLFIYGVRKINSDHFLPGLAGGFSFGMALSIIQIIDLEKFFTFS